MKRPQEITKQLKMADDKLKNYVIEMEKENSRLHKKIARLQTKNVSCQHEIKALKTAIKALEKKPPFDIVLQNYSQSKKDT